MAKEATEIASEARDMAVKALSNQDMHEAVCAERYKGIDQRLQQLPEISRAIGTLKGSINKAVGAIMGLSILSTILAIFAIVGKI